MKTILLLAALFFLTYNVDAQIYACTADSDCINDANCDTNKGVCECDSGKIFKNDGSACLDLAPGVKGACVEDSQCSLLNGLNKCVDGACWCEEGWVYFRGKCIKKIQNNGACNNDDECFDGVTYNSRICLNNKCQCRNGFYERDVYDCRPKAEKEGDDCALDLDCKFKNGFCDGGKCALIQETKINRIFEDNVTIDDIPIVDNIGDICVSNSDCSSVANSYCSQIFKTCTCNPGRFLLKNVCELELGMPCTDDTECKAASGVCTDGVCVCEKTLSDLDNKKCKKTQPVSPVFKCTTDDTCKVFVENYFCDGSSATKQCKCNLGFKQNAYFVCSEASECKWDQECTEIKQNSICKDGDCQCGDNFKEFNATTCLPLLTGKCANSDECSAVENSECSDGVCMCKKYFTSNSISECNPKVDLNQSCRSNDDCKQSNAFCSGEVCECEEGYLNIDDKKCLKAATKIGEHCTDERICSANLGLNVRCRNDICQCSADMVPTKNKLDCQVNGANMPLINYLPIFASIIYIMLVS